MHGDTDGQKARLTIGEVERLIGVGQWTKRKLCKMENKIKKVCN